MIALIKGIGCTMVELDKDPSLYLSRSFCVVEAFATIDTDNNAMLVILDYVAACKIDEILEASPVDVLAAQTRPGKEADKDMVDAFINGKNLADTMNARITVALREGAASVIEQSHNGRRVFDYSITGLTNDDARYVLELLAAAGPTLEAVNVLRNEFDVATANELVAAAGARETACSLCGGSGAVDDEGWMNLQQKSLGDPDAVLVSHDMGVLSSLRVLQMSEYEGVNCGDG